jgi:hypothetical protein
MLDQLAWWANALKAAREETNVEPVSSPSISPPAAATLRKTNSESRVRI